MKSKWVNYDNLWDYCYIVYLYTYSEALAGWEIHRKQSRTEGNKS